MAPEDIPLSFKHIALETRAHCNIYHDDIFIDCKQNFLYAGYEMDGVTLRLGSGNILSELMRKAPFFDASSDVARDEVQVRPGRYTVQNHSAGNKASAREEPAVFFAMQTNC